MTTPRQLNAEEQRIATLEYLCGIDSDKIAQQFEVSQHTILQNVVRRYSRELHDPLIEFYRAASRHQKDKNAAHFYLSWRGWEVPQRELVKKNDELLDTLYTYVRKTFFVPFIEEIPQELEGFFYPSNGYEYLLQDVFDDQRTFGKNVAESLFEKSLFNEYQTSSDFRLSSVFAQAGKMLFDGIKEGNLAMTSRKKALVHEVLSTLKPREAQVIEMRYGLGNYDKKHTLEEIRPSIGNVIRERVRQIGAKALRKMRHPTRTFWLSIIRGLSSNEEVEAYVSMLSYQATMNRISDDTKVYELGLRYHVATKLYCNNVITLGQLKETSEADVRRYRGFGRKSVDNVKKTLREKGIDWGS